MWCGHEGSNTKERVNDIITYFEGTCEYCVGNMGIESYKNEIENLIDENIKFDEETMLLLYYADSVINYRIENFDTAFEEWAKAEKLARETGNQVFLAKVYSYLAIYYYVKKDMACSDDYFNRAKKIFEDKKLYNELALQYINILWYKRYEKNQQVVMDYLNKAFYYVQLSNSRTDARVYLHLGYIYKTIFNDFIKGFKHLTMAQEMCYRNGNYEMECMTFHVLADGYMQLDHFDQTIKIYRDIFDNERYRDVTANLKCMMLGNLIPAYMKVGDLESAANELKHMEAYVPLTQVNFREQFSGMAKLLRAKLSIALGRDLDEALVLLEECVAYSEKYPNNPPCEDFDFQLAGSFGAYYQAIGDYEKALSFFSSQMEKADKYGKMAKMQAAMNIADVYERLGSYQEALEYRKQKMDIFKSLEQERLMRQYDELYKEFVKGIEEKQIRSLSAEQRELEKNAVIDSLTGVYNRRYFDDCILAIEKNPPEHMITVIFVDVDYFKNYNDGFGHSKGDDCLAKVGAVLQDSIRDKEGKAFRYGGEEFILLLEGLTDAESLLTANYVVENVRNLYITHPWSEVAKVVTVSAGCSAGRITARKQIKDLIEDADKALYYVKRNGRNNARMAEA